jgi:hypothetical protein
MSAIKNGIARRAVKATAKHSAHGTAAKLKREPVRVVTLLGLGGALGALAGFVAGRTAASASAGPGS